MLHLGQLQAEGDIHDRPGLRLPWSLRAPEKGIAKLRRTSRRSLRRSSNQW